jgi:hypothetical protein
MLVIAMSGTATRRTPFCIFPGREKGSFMWKISKSTDKKRVVLRISGRINAEELPELQMAVSSEETTHGKVELDLECVRLVDQQVVTYLACCEAEGTTLRNCPSYIREWIDRENGGQNHRSNGENQDLSGN